MSVESWREMSLILPMKYNSIGSVSTIKDFLEERNSSWVYEEG